MANAGRLAVAIDGAGAGFPPLREVAGWLESFGVRLWVPGRSFAPPAAEELSSAALGAKVLAVRHVCHRRADGRGDLAGRDLLDPARPIGDVAASLVATAAYATASLAGWILVEIGPPPGEVTDASRSAARGRLLDRACRILHAALRDMPGVGIALLTPSQPADFGRPDELAAIFEDLGPKRRLAYWHDAGRAHVLAERGIAPVSEWLSRHGARCVGVDASDATGAIGGLPAGAGEVDFVELRAAVAASVPFVARVEPFSGPGPLLAAVNFLRELGL
jgi:sugar phosphate isomerase/epimerase